MLSNSCDYDERDNSCHITADFFDEGSTRRLPTPQTVNTILYMSRPKDWSQIRFYALHLTRIYL